MSGLNLSVSILPTKTNQSRPINIIYSFVLFDYQLFPWTHVGTVILLNEISFPPMSEK